MSQGIFGVIDFGKQIESPDLLADDMGIFLRENRDEKGEISYVCKDHYVLGMKRICCGPCGEQDEITHNSKLQAISLVNGEIHNYKDLLQGQIDEDEYVTGDLDLLIHLYRSIGPEFAKKLNGLFSLAILDQRNSSIIIINDRFGMAHQIYWTIMGSRFCFASHLKMLLGFPEIKREVDREGLNLFFKYSYISSPWTIFKGIKKLPPGHVLVFRAGKVSVNSYWEFSCPDGSRMDFQEAISTYRGLLRRSISRRLQGNGGVGILLSGGLDSSANVALAAESTDEKLKTFSVGFDDPGFDERPYARIVSKHFNTEHYETTMTGEEIEDLPKLIWHLEEPYFEFGLFLTYIGMRSARREVDTVIGGEGADQLFGTGGFAGGRPAAIPLSPTANPFLALATCGRAFKIKRGIYFYKHDNLAFKFRLLWQ